MRKACWSAAVIVLLLQCAVRLDPVPTTAHPRLACIADSPLAPMQRSKMSGARVLPEIVRVIGVTSPEDGERWKVLRAGEMDPAKWQPWPKEKIQFAGCGPEMAAYAEIASQRSPE